MFPVAGTMVGAGTMDEQHGTRNLLPAVGGGDRYDQISGCDPANPDRPRQEPTAPTHRGPAGEIGSRTTAAANSLGYWRWGGCGLHFGAEKA